MKEERKASRWSPGLLKLLESGESAIAPIVIIPAILIVVFVVAAVVVWAVIRETSHPNEETAKFLPADTELYYSLNLRPGIGQLLKVRKMIGRYTDNPDFQDKVDDFLDRAELELGIDLMEDVTPWLGPELAIGFIDVVEFDENPKVVAFVGTRDREAAEDVVRRLIQFQVEEEGLEYEEGSYKGFPTFSFEYEEIIAPPEATVEVKRAIAPPEPIVEVERAIAPHEATVVAERAIAPREATVVAEKAIAPPKPIVEVESATAPREATAVAEKAEEVVVVEEAHIAVTDDYLVFASTLALLHSTIDMMEESVNPLSENERFREARDSVQEQRFTFLYVDFESIIDQALAGADDAGTGDLQRFRNMVPETLAVSGAFMDSGIRVEGSFNTPAGFSVFPPPNSLGSAEVLPHGSLALFSFTGLQEALDGARSQLEAAPTFGFGIFGFGIIDEAIAEFEREVGIDLDRDVLGWMTGEVAVALLPSDLRFDILEGSMGTIHAQALFQFEERRDAESGIDKIVEIIEDAGILFETVQIGGKEARLADLSEVVGETDYSPGFLILDDYVVLGSTRESLRMAVDVDKGGETSLAAESEFSRLAELAPGAKNSLIYLNIKELIGSIVSGLSTEDQEGYRKEASPFLEPLRAFLATAETNQDRTSFTLVLTIE